MVLKNTGIDTDIFKTHSVCGASTTAAMNSNVQLDDVMKMALRLKFYNKPIFKVNSAHSVYFQVALGLKMVMANYLLMLQFLRCLLVFSHTQPLFCTLRVKALNST